MISHDLSTDSLRYITAVASPADDRVLTGTELKFTPVTLADLPLINQLLQHSTTRTCDYTVGGIFMWVELFGYEYCVYDDTLFIKGRAEDDARRTAFSLPLGKLPLDEAVALLRAYCRANGLELSFSAVPEDHVAALGAVTGGAIEPLEDWSDYLYDINALASLTGKALSKKRNHVNRFMVENPDYIYEPLTPELTTEVMLFLDGLGMSDKADPAMATREKRETLRVLRHYSSYPFEGAVLRSQSGEIVAFTIGEIIDDTLYVHIEKMNHEVNGAGETINRLFAADMLHRHPHLRYANREEDMGDPGLRHAKQSYHPIALLNKYNIYC